MSGPTPLEYVTPPSRQPGARPARGLLGWIIFVGVAAILFAFLRQSGSQYAPITLSDFYHQAKEGNIADALIGEDSIQGHFRTQVALGGAPIANYRVYIPTGTTAMFTQTLLEMAPPAVVRAEPTNTFLGNVVLPLVPWVLILGFIWLFVLRPFRRNAARQGPVPAVTVADPEAR